ncbi:MAG: MFS transporter [Chloroflexota bacterium]
MPADEAKPVTAKITKKPRYFYGWNIVGAAFMAQLAYAQHFSSNLGLFFKPLQAEFGFTRSAMAAIQTVARMTEGVTAPIVGPFIDRYGPRILMPLGAIIVAVGSILATRSTSVWQFYLTRGITTAFGYTLLGVLVVDVTISKWFARKRGRATGITRIGSSLSTFIMTPLTVFVIEKYGWRQMFVVFAVFTLSTVLLPALIFMRRRPEDMGLLPDGDEPGAMVEALAKGKLKPSSVKESVAPEKVWSRREVLRNSAFWLVAATYTVDAFAFQAINISMPPYFQDLGHGAAVVAAVLTFRGVVMAVAAPVAGFAAEHANRPVIRAIPFMMQCVAAVLFLMAKSPVFLWLAVVVYGTALASTGVTQAVVWADFFGRHSLGTVRSMAYFLIFGFGAIGPVVMNAIYDVTGSYRPAFLGIFVLFVIASLMIMAARPPKPRTVATPTTP